jgi:hypothetical protein
MDHRYEVVGYAPRSGIGDRRLIAVHAMYIIPNSKTTTPTEIPSLSGALRGQIRRR